MATSASCAATASERPFAPRARAFDSSEASPSTWARVLSSGLGTRVREPLALCSATLGVREHRSHGAAVLAFQVRVQLEAFLHLSKPVRIRLQVVQVAVQVPAQVLQLI
jgi:hypothetical protein